jgi:hypothetical protein
MTYAIIYLLIGVLFAAFVDMNGGITFKIKEKIGLIIAWPYLLVVGLKEFFKN